MNITINSRRTTRIYAICCMVEIVLIDKMPAMGYLVSYCEGRSAELNPLVKVMFNNDQIGRLHQETFKLSAEDYAWLNEYEPDRRLIDLLRSW